MKTAQEWQEELSGETSVESIAEIQFDAYKQGQEDTMKWVSQFCKDQNERLAAMRFQETLQ